MTMTALPLQNFNPADIPEDDRNFDPIPAGTYKMQVIESRLEDTKSGSGQMLVLTLEVIDGQYQNRRVWDRLNIVNDNADAQRIAQRALADLCLQIGVAPLKDSEQLHFKPFMGKVTIQPDKTGQYGPQNRVRYNVNLNQAQQGQQQRPAPQGGQQQRRPQQAQQRPQQGGNKPWSQPQQGRQQANQELNDDPPF
jgi:hypothetical protein